MNIFCRNAVALITLFVACLSISVAEAKDEPIKVAVAAKTLKTETVKISNAANAFKEISTLPKKKIPPELFKEAVAVVIAAQASKSSFMVNGGTNSGMLLVRDKGGTWSNPVFISISGGTLGWQIVGDPMDIVLIFKNNRQIDALLKGKTTLDAKVKIVSGRVAASMKGATKEELNAEITSYVRSHGVFVEEGVVAGATLKIDSAANDAFYGTAKIAPKDILSGAIVKSDENITALHKYLGDYITAK